jgi:transposase InsO family protein
LYGFNIVKIAHILKCEEVDLSHTTVGKILQREGEKNWRTTTKTYKRVKRFEREKPNDLWQIDIKGPFWVEEQGQHLYLVSVIDDHSRFCVGARFYPHTVKTGDILQLLDQAMQTYSTPRQILTDNGAIFHPQRGGISSFTRWCQTGIIDHIRARAYHPETCGKVERLHGTIIREMFRLGLAYCNSELRRYRDYYNFSRPHQGINLSTPGERFMNVPLTLQLPSSVTHVC